MYIVSATASNLIFVVGIVVRTDMLYALPEHHLVEDLASCHAHEAVVHLWLPKRLQRLDISNFLVAVEGRTGHCSLGRRRRGRLR